MGCITNMGPNCLHKHRRQAPLSQARGQSYRRPCFKPKVSRATYRSRGIDEMVDFGDKVGTICGNYRFRWRQEHSRSSSATKTDWHDDWCPNEGFQAGCWSMTLTAGVEEVDCVTEKVHLDGMHHQHGPQLSIPTQTTSPALTNSWTIP